jgi:hypothetical protein
MSRNSKSAPNASEKTRVQHSSRAQLEKQIADFLKGGGEIQQIPNGMSANLSPASRQKPRPVKGSPPPKS